MSIFPARALLQINVDCLVENKDVDSAMIQVIPMHFGAACIAQNPVHPIDHWKGLILDCVSVVAGGRCDVICQANPLNQR